MLFNKNLRHFLHLDELVRKKRSGNPDVLARKLGVSRRTVFRLIDQLKSLDAPIVYCRKLYIAAKSSDTTIRNHLI